MFKLSSIRWYVSTYEDLNIFQRIIFRINFKKQLKKQVKYDKLRESLEIPDFNFNDYLSRFFNA